MKAPINTKNLYDSDDNSSSDSSSIFHTHLTLQKSVEDHNDNVSTEEYDVGTASKDLHSQIKALENQLHQEKQRTIMKITQFVQEQKKTERLQQQVIELQQTLKHHVQDHKESAKQWISTREILQKQMLQLKQENAILKGENKTTIKDLQAKDNTNVSNSSVQTPVTIPRTKLSEIQFQRWKKEFHDKIVKIVRDSPFRREQMESVLNQMWELCPVSNIYKNPTSSRVKSTEKVDSEGKDTIKQLRDQLKTQMKEMRVLKAKHLELKEVCARQCVREADLQNFVNDLRLKHRRRHTEQVKPNEKVSPSIKASANVEAPGLNLTSHNGSRDNSTGRQFDIDMYQDMRKVNKKPDSLRSSNIERVRLVRLSPNYTQDIKPHSLSELKVNDHNGYKDFHGKEQQDINDSKVKIQRTRSKQLKKLNRKMKDEINVARSIDPEANRANSSKYSSPVQTWV